MSGANAQRRIKERIELPTLSTVAQFLSRHPQEQWLAFRLDFSKAHKQVKVHPAETGAQHILRQRPQRGYKVGLLQNLPFGCAWAAYWWSRVAAAFIRVAHRFLHHSHFCIYVDDALALFPHRVAAPMACQLLILACVLGFGTRLTLATS